MIDKVEQDICKTQGELYEYAALHDYMFPQFSDIYMKSDFCKRAMDAKYSRFQIREPEELMDFLVPENPELDQNMYKNGECFDNDVAFWIGYIYRYLAFESRKASSELYKLYPFGNLVKAYPGLHTVDDDMAIDILLKRLA